MATEKTQIRRTRQEAVLRTSRGTLQEEPRTPTKINLRIQDPVGTQLTHRLTGTLLLPVILLNKKIFAFSCILSLCQILSRTEPQAPTVQPSCTGNSFIRWKGSPQVSQLLAISFPLNSQITQAPTFLQLQEMQGPDPGNAAIFQVSITSCFSPPPCRNPASSVPPFLCKLILGLQRKLKPGIGQPSSGIVKSSCFSPFWLLP